MTTLNELKAEHPERCWNCGDYTEAGDCVSCRVHPLIAALTAAKLEDEATIAERTTQRDECGRLAAEEAIKVWNLRIDLFAEQSAHAATKEELRKADEALIRAVESGEPEAAVRRAYEISRARQYQRAAQSNAEPDLDKCPQCGGEADNGHDRCLPPNPYFCSKCSPQRAADPKEKP